MNPMIENKEKQHFVDERFELVALVFKLAGNPEYNKGPLKYKRLLNKSFGRFKAHPIIRYTKQNLKFGYDAIALIAVHLEKVDGKFVLVDHLAAVFEDDDITTRWTKENIVDFVQLLNDFYMDIKFSVFFLDQTAYYKKHSERFMKQCLTNIAFEWFAKHDLNLEKMQVILSPTIWGGYGAHVEEKNSSDKLVYAILNFSMSATLWTYYHYDWFLAHEFIHSFANSFALKWYEENETFRKWCKETAMLNGPQIRYYGGQSMTIACEYVTRAYTILYLVENKKGVLSKLFREEKNNISVY